DVLDAGSPQAGGDGDPGAPAAADGDAVMDGRGHRHLPGAGSRARGSSPAAGTVAPRGVSTGGVPPLHYVRTIEGGSEGGKGMVAVEPSRTAGVALWRQVQHDLRRRIDAEEFVDAFPGEKVLAQEYGVSRQTMRQALRPLRES